MSEWTKESPTESGWYWWRANDTMPAYVIHYYGMSADMDRHGEWWSDPIHPPQ